MIFSLDTYVSKLNNRNTITKYKFKIKDAIMQIEKLLMNDCFTCLKWVL